MKRISLIYKFLKHDIDQWTYRIGNMSIDDPEQKAFAQSDNRSTDVSFYRRKIEEAIGILRGLANMRLMPVQDNLDDAITHDDTEWVFGITDGLFRTDHEAVKDMLHRFVVRYVVKEWCDIYAPDHSASVEAEKNEAWAVAEKELFRRCPPLKAKQQEGMI